MNLAAFLDLMPLVFKTEMIKSAKLMKSLVSILRR